MIYWHEQLLVDEPTNNNLKKAKRIIKKRYKHVYDVYKKGLFSKLAEKVLPKKNYHLLVVPTNPENLFEIVDLKNLIFSCYTGQDLYVIGIAKERDNIYDILEGMLKNSLFDEADDLRSLCDKSRFIADDVGRGA